MTQEKRKFSSLVEVLDFAINREIEPHDFYVRLADMVNRPELVKILRDFATEEVEHRIKLEAVKAGEATIGEEEAGDLDIADYVPNIEPHPGMSYVDLLVVAMKKEKLSYKLYTDLAAVTRRKDFRGIFRKLAMEEAYHKLRFELEYDLSTFGTKRKK
jgi:rubrerythrin